MWVPERRFLCITPEDKETQELLGIKHVDEELNCSVFTIEGLEYLRKMIPIKKPRIVLNVVEERRDPYTGKRWRVVIAQFPNLDQIELVIELWLRIEKLLDVLQYLARP